MDNTRFNRLKEVLSVPTKTYQEENMVQYLRDVLDAMPDVEYYTDDMNNVYATKGTLNEGEYYPMFIAHTDTVHQLVDKIVVQEESLVKPDTFGHTYGDEEFLSLKGYTPNGSSTGIGGDDKCGVFIALELLRVLPKVKIGLFVSEETGCHGSSKCDINFLNDVGYAVQFDAPGNNLITEVCSGTRLYEKDGDFINKALPLFNEIMGVNVDPQSHPYTDVSQIKRKGDFSCINFSCGYYNMHTENEFVVVDDVNRAVEFSIKLVNRLENKKYIYEYEKPNYNDYGTLFDVNDDVLGEWDDYEEETYELENITVTDYKEGLSIESKFTGDVIYMDESEVGELYEILREKLLSMNYQDELDEASAEGSTRFFN